MFLYPLHTIIVMAHISKNTLAVLMVATVVISVFGVWLTLLVATGQLKVPVAPSDLRGSGEVSVFVKQDPPASSRIISEDSGQVAVFVK